MVAEELIKPLLKKENKSMPELTSTVEGVGPGLIYLVVARTNVGKTSFATCNRASFAQPEEETKNKDGDVNVCSRTN